MTLTKERIEAALDVFMSDIEGEPSDYESTVIAVLKERLETSDKVLESALEELDQEPDWVDENTIDMRLSIPTVKAIRAAMKGRLLLPELTLEMQQAYFEVIDKNEDRVNTDPLFGRYENQKEAYTAMMKVAPSSKVFDTWQDKALEGIKKEFRRLKEVTMTKDNLSFVERMRDAMYLDGVIVVIDSGLS